MARHVVTEVECADPGEHPAAKAWASLDSNAVTPARIMTLKERHKMSAKSAVYRLEGVDAQLSSIIAKHCRCWSARLERSIYEQILPRLSLEAVCFRGFLEETGGECCWLFTEDAGDHWYSPSKEGHRVLLGRWLGILHTQSVEIEAVNSLPRRGSDYFRGRLTRICRGIEQIQSNLAMSPNHRKLLGAIFSQCRALSARWSAVDERCHCLPDTLVHGDLVRKNLRIKTVRSEQRVLAVDWENACFGVPAIDLANLPRVNGFPDFVASPDLVSYLAVVQHHWGFLDAETLEDLANVGTLFRCLDALVWEIERLEANGYIDRCMQRVEIFRQILVVALRSRNWND